MNKPVFTGPGAFRAALGNILSTLPPGTPGAVLGGVKTNGDVVLSSRLHGLDLSQRLAALGPDVKVREILVPDGSDITEVIAKAVADIRAEVNAERASEQNGVNAVSVDTVCDCPACAPTQLAVDDQNYAQDEGQREDPLAKLFRSRAKRLVEAFVAIAFPGVDAWTSESSVGNSSGYTFDLHVTGIEDLDTAETITITIPDTLMMTASNLELASGLTGVLNYVGASISALVD